MVPRSWYSHQRTKGEGKESILGAAVGMEAGEWGIGCGETGDRVGRRRPGWQARSQGRCFHALCTFCLQQALTKQAGCQHPGHAPSLAACQAAASNDEAQ